MARVLIIEDDADYRDYLVAQLEHAGHVAISLPNGSAIEALVREHDFDVVLTDIYMPEADGIESIRTVRRLLPGLPVLGMTGGGRGSFAGATARAMKLFGAEAVLYKPIEPSRLLRAITDAAHEKRGNTTPQTGRTV